VQPEAATSNRNQVSPDRLAKTVHYVFFGRPPRRRATHPSALLTTEA